jgi:hypothetical protein
MTLRLDLCTCNMAAPVQVKVLTTVSQNLLGTGSMIMFLLPYQVYCLITDLCGLNFKVRYNHSSTALIVQVSKT